MKTENIRWWLSTFFRYRLPGHIKRWKEAIAYGMGRTTEAQALDIMYVCRQVAGTHCLISIDYDRVLESARDRWGDHPNMERWCRYGAQRVGSKWDDSGETRGIAEHWALTLVEEYANAEGVKLVEQEYEEAES